MVMRIPAVIAAIVLPLAAQARPPQCGDGKAQHADLLSYEQWQAVLSERADGDPVLEEAIAVEKVKYGAKAPVVGDPIKIGWAQARKLVLLGAIRQTFEAHDLTVMLLSISGRRYTTKQPTLNELSRVVAAVDPCAIFIMRVLE